MQISARTDYAVRAPLLLASRSPDLVKVDVLTDQQGLPGILAPTLSVCAMQRIKDEGWDNEVCLSLLTPR